MSNPYETAKHKTSVLGPTLRFKGELSADEDILIQGRIEGSIEHSSNLTIGPEGRVEANVKAEYIAIEGSVKGDLTGGKSVVIRDTANIDGNVYSPVVTLLEGAKFNGSIDMSGKTAAAASEERERAESAEKASAAEAAAKPQAPRSESSPAPAKKKSQRSEKKSASAA